MDAFENCGDATVTNDVVMGAEIAPGVRMEITETTALASIVNERRFSRRQKAQQQSHTMDPTHLLSVHQVLATARAELHHIESQLSRRTCNPQDATLISTQTSLLKASTAIRANIAVLLRDVAQIRQHHERFTVQEAALATREQTIAEQEADLAGKFQAIKAAEAQLVTRQMAVQAAEEHLFSLIAASGSIAWPLISLQTVAATSATATARGSIPGRIL
ncbi:hypothetical protein EDC01DRAFT_781504 [Geopyxis carbonaria]|nr:hypothetical protein EDC01DRAFT_781504 [Geopyxis carbonaria]